MDPEELRREVIAGCDRLLSLGWRFLPDHARRVVSAQRRYWSEADHLTMSHLAALLPNSAPPAPEGIDPTTLFTIKDHLRQAQISTWVTPTWKQWYANDVPPLLQALGEL